MTRPGFAKRQDLERWADAIGAAAELPRLIRRLILETGKGMAEVSFPAAEGTRVGDWDGTVKATESTAFVPAGVSGWELSVDKRAATKAERDYAKRTTSPDGSPTNDCTYVAVSLRIWTDRKDFVARHRNDGRWKEVRAIGLDEIDAWIEDAPVTHAWLSEELGLGPHGLKTTDTWWKQWSTATKPPLPSALMLSGRKAEAEALRNFLEAEPATLTMSAASRDEVLAFVASVADAEQKTGSSDLLARTAFVDEVGTWRSLRERRRPLVLVAASDSVVAETTGQQESHHVIVPVPQSLSAKIKLSPIDATAAAEVLKPALGEKAAEEIARLARMSLTAARRRLAVNPALHEPVWARPPTPTVLRRLLLAGRWNGQSDNDIGIVSGLANVSTQELSDETAKYAAGDDPVLARIGASVSAISPYDAWLLLRDQLTTDDLAAFREIALEVLGTRNPALDLAPDERYQANVVGKARPHTEDLRRGIANSLALLGSLAEGRLADSSQTGADWAAAIVRELLGKANEQETADGWASLDDVLPLLAEAAPEEFLRAVDKGLRGDAPLLTGIFVDKDLGILGHSSHTGLLWALELCAWSPDHFGEAIDLLARLVEIDPGGRMANRPFKSLDEIFCPWHPQNSVDNERSLDVIDGLRERHPSVAWRLLLELLPNSFDVGGYTYAPHYRSWKPTKERGFVPAEYWPFTGRLFERVLLDVRSDVERWKKVIEGLGNVPPDLREQALKRLETLAQSGNLADIDRAAVRDALLRFVRHHREFSDADWALPEADLEPIVAVASRFEPETALAKHAWLFAEDSPTLDMKRHDNWDAYQSALAQQRAEAAREILGSSSWGEVLEFARQGKTPGFLGAAIAEAGVDGYEAELLASLNSEDSVELTLGRGYAIKRLEKDSAWLDRIKAQVTSRQHARLILALWDLQKEWARLEGVGLDVRTEYWREFPWRGQVTNDQLKTIVEGLRSVGRLAAAINVLALSLPKETEAEIAEMGAALLETYQKDDEGTPDAHHILRVFQYLDRTPTIDRSRLARLEWTYLPALEYQGRRFVLHQAMAENPDLFVDLVTRMYRPRRDQGEPEENAEEEVPPDETAKNVARNAFRLLYHWRTVPAATEDGTIDGGKLRDWVRKARQQLANQKRGEVGDVLIGEILAHGPADPDGTWPTRPVRDLIEDLRNDDIIDGFTTGTINSRGPTWRALEGGGQQERDRVARYRGLADRVKDRWPRTAAALRAIADSYERHGRVEDDRAERFREGWEGPPAGPLRIESGEPELAEAESKDRLLYFAYGSNMDTTQMVARIGGTPPLRGVAGLRDHALTFDKKSSRDGSGKANVRRRKNSVVYGVLFELTNKDYEALSAFEKGYRDESVSLVASGQATSARTFVAKKTSTGLRPTRAYLDLIIKGATEHGLPGAYIAKLKRVRAN